MAMIVFFRSSTSKKQRKSSTKCFTKHDNKSSVDGTVSKPIELSSDSEDSDSDYSSSSSSCSSSVKLKGAKDYLTNCSPSFKLSSTETKLKDDKNYSSDELSSISGSDNDSSSSESSESIVFLEEEGIKQGDGKATTTNPTSGNNQYVDDQMQSRQKRLYSMSSLESDGYNEDDAVLESFSPKSRLKKVEGQNRSDDMDCEFLSWADDTSDDSSSNSHATNLSQVNDDGSLPIETDDNQVESSSTEGLEALKYPTSDGGCDDGGNAK